MQTNTAADILSKATRGAVLQNKTRVKLVFIYIATIQANRAVIPKKKGGQLTRTSTERAST